MSVVRGLKNVRAYLDDLLTTATGMYEEHLAEVKVIIKCLHNAGLNCKIDKRTFAKPEIEYLGYIITKEGVKPNPNKIQAIIDLQRPSTKTEVRHFLGMVQYYHDLWPRRSEILAPLTELMKGMKKGSVIWTDKCEITFNEMKRIIAKDMLLAYPDFNKKFTIHTQTQETSN